jgi:RNA polymerase sigma-70 factor (ECF subfamily)
MNCCGLQEGWIITMSASCELMQSDSSTTTLNTAFTANTARSQDEQYAIARTLAGDLNAFNELVVRYQNLAYSVAYRMLQSREAASDAVQDSFVKAYRALPSLRNGNGSFKSWLMRIVVNTCHDIIRINGRVILEEISDDASYELNDDSGKNKPLQLIDAHESPQAFVERMELSAQIELGLRALPAEQRLVLMLCDIHGYSYEEIHEITGWPMGTIKSRISRARLKLRDFLLQQPDLVPAGFAC